MSIAPEAQDGMPPAELVAFIKKISGADGVVILLRKDDAERGALVQFIQDEVLSEAQINGMFLSGIYSNMHSAKMKQFAAMVDAHNAAQSVNPDAPSASN